MESTRKQLIDLLEKNDGAYISGQLLSEKLHISRTAVWKHMKELEKDGYVIEGKPRKGYRIVSFPEKMSENTIQWGLKTKWLGKTIVHKPTVDSTQIVAHKLANENAAHGTVVIADTQTAGKGRMNRTWHSAKNKGIWLSILLRPKLPPHLASQLTLMTAVALAEAIKKETKLSPQIKWPNDLLINRKKIAGILTEMQAEHDQIQYIVIGIGLNVNQNEDDLPNTVKEKATSLKIESGQEYDLKQLTQAILLAFEQEFDTYMKGGFAKIKSKWEKIGFKLGEKVFIKTMKREWPAFFAGISEDGALMIRDETGTISKLYSAEIDWFGGEE